MSYERISYERWTESADATPESMVAALRRLPNDVTITNIETRHVDVSTYAHNRVTTEPAIIKITAERRAS
ncbi:hypothetical protein [Gryllotalpicola koreensis]|uniref:Transporter n=1 Tax=Gryllotalpicola koreensis TaxID=993086 RepID=A0ABP8A305_9MICO